MSLIRRSIPVMLAGALLVGGTSSAFAAKTPKAKATHATTYGVVSNLTGATFTLTTPNSSTGVTVTLAPNAKERARKGTAGALANGEYAAVAGVQGANGITARRVVYSTTAFTLKTKKAKKARAISYGVVSNLNGNTFTLTPSSGSAVTVTLSPKGKERARKGTTGALVNGDYAAVAGIKTDTGITARHVLYATSAFTLRSGKHAAKTATGGVVLAQSSATTLVIANKKGKTHSFTIVSGTTKFRQGTTVLSSAPTFTDGQRVRVRYTVDKTTKQLTAQVVVIRAAK